MVGTHKVTHDNAMSSDQTDVYCLLSSVKRDTLRKWYHEGLDSKLEIMYDEELGETVLSFNGKHALSTDHLIYPNPQRRTTEPYPELTLSNLNFIIKVDNDPFSMEVVVEDSKNEDRVLRFKSTMDNITTRPLICFLPLPLHNTPWTQFTLNLNHLVNTLYDTKYTRLKMLQISSTCKLRKIFLAKMENYSVRMLFNPRRASPKVPIKAQCVANKYRMNRAKEFRLATQNQTKEKSALDDLVQPNLKLMPEKKKTDVSQTKRSDVLQSKKMDFSDWKNKLKTIEETTPISGKKQTEAKSTIIGSKRTNITNVSSLKSKSAQVLEKTKMRVENKNKIGPRKPTDRNVPEKKPKSELKKTSLENDEMLDNQNQVKVVDDHNKKIVEEYVEDYMRNRLENTTRSLENLIAMNCPEAQERKDSKLGQKKCILRTRKKKSEEIISQGTCAEAEANEGIDNATITLDEVETRKVIECTATVIRGKVSENNSVMKPETLTTKKPIVKLEKGASKAPRGKVPKVKRKASAGIKNYAVKPTTNTMTESIDKNIDMLNKKILDHVDETMEVLNKNNSETNDRSLKIPNKKSRTSLSGTSVGTSKQSSSLRNKVPATLAHTRFSKELEKYDYL